jgi:hypothetical protein
MIPNKIFELGSLLGVAPGEIEGIVSTNSNLNTREVKSGTVGTNDLSTYKHGIFYGTISINDF